MPHPALLVRSTYVDALLNMSGLVSYWRLAEGGGTTFYDVKNANPCPINGAPTFGKGSALFNDDDRACGFPGNNAINGLIASPSLPAGATARTMIGWIKTSAANSVPQSLISYGAGATRQALGLKINDQGFATKPNVGFWTFGNDFYFAKTANNGAWHMLAVTVVGSGTTAQMYLDGVPAGGITTLSGNLATSSTNLYIARDNFDATKSPVNGSIDELSIGNVALSAGQIAFLYALGRGT